MDVEKLIEIGGKEWHKDNMNRIYFNSELIKKICKVDVAYYNTGNIFSCSIDGEHVSNSQARKVLPGYDSKLWYDVDTNEFCKRDLSDYMFNLFIEKINLL